MDGVCDATWIRFRGMACNHDRLQSALIVHRPFIPFIKAITIAAVFIIHYHFLPAPPSSWGVGGLPLNCWQLLLQKSWRANVKLWNAHVDVCCPINNSNRRMYLYFVVYYFLHTWTVFNVYQFWDGNVRGMNFDVHSVVSGLLGRSWSFSRSFSELFGVKFKVSVFVYGWLRVPKYF